MEAWKEKTAESHKSLKEGEKALKRPGTSNVILLSALSQSLGARVWRGWSYRVWQNWRPTARACNVDFGEKASGCLRDSKGNLDEVVRIS